MDLKRYIALQRVEDPNFSQRSFAKSMGMHFQTLWRIANGRGVPNARHAMAIEEATNGEVELGELIRHNFECKEKKKKEEKDGQSPNGKKAQT